jgi:hypothetical protein
MFEIVAPSLNERLDQERRTGLPFAKPAVGSPEPVGRHRWWMTRRELTCSPTLIIPRIWHTACLSSRVQGTALSESCCFGFPAKQSD